ncbi:Hypothetical protein ADU70_1581 [Pediococcus damnosus]|uniref:Uncharacterized protein n=1 Tax=Pediococcus damnosus TaxID=51663 RepID=A0AAC9B2Q6_9LACO|nr:Hypothetical protein ADU70_1581 [Pediococcus damnosus]
MCVTPFIDIKKPSLTANVLRTVSRGATSIGFILGSRET